MIQRFAAIVNIVASLSLGLVTLLTFVSVILRFGFSETLPDAFDSSRLIQGVALSWGIALVVWHRGHIRMAVPWGALGPRWEQGVDLFADIVSSALLAVMSWAMLGRALSILSSGLATNELRIPIWPVSYIIAAGIVASFLAATILVLRQLVFRK